VIEHISIRISALDERGQCVDGKALKVKAIPLIDDKRVLAKLAGEVARLAKELASGVKETTK
jgi:hypothetical protein